MKRAIIEAIAVLLVAPAVVIGLLRFYVWFAGAEWSNPGFAVFVACTIGSVSACARVVFYMDNHND